MPMTPEQRTMRARLAALARWSTEDPSAQMKNARAKFDARFERLVDPAGELPEPERIRRAQAARKAYYVAMALASSRARSKK